VGITAFYLPDIAVENLLEMNPGFYFVPFGTVMFAFLAFTALPEMERIMERDKDKMKKAIMIGSLIPLIVYTIFTFIVVGFMGDSVPEIATFSLGRIFVALGVIAMSTSFLALAVVMKRVLHYDYNIERATAWLMVTLSTFALFILSFKFDFTFTEILNVSGVVSGSLAGILILLMVEKAKKNSDRIPEYSLKINKFILAIILLIFVVGGVMSLS
jgi:amino acid permease